MIIIGKTQLSVSTSLNSLYLPYLMCKSPGTRWFQVRNWHDFVQLRPTTYPFSVRQLMISSRGSNIMPGWSALGGQAQSAYTTGAVDLTDRALGHSVSSGK